MQYFLFLHSLAYKSCRKTPKLVSILPRHVNNTSKDLAALEQCLSTITITICES